MQIGFKALDSQCGIELVQPLCVESTIASARAARESPQGIENQFPAVYRPADTFAGHFEFGLKYEEIHLEFFARLFAACGPEPLEAWCRALWPVRPSGRLLLQVAHGTWTFQI